MNQAENEFLEEIYPDNLSMGFSKMKVFYFR